MQSDGLAVAERRDRQMLLVGNQVLVRVYHYDEPLHQASINYGTGFEPSVYFVHNGQPMEFAPRTTRAAYYLASHLVRSAHRDICKRKWSGPWQLRGPQTWVIDEQVDCWKGEPSDY